MSIHANLEFNYLAEAQSDKYITANEALQIITDALTDSISKSVAGTGDISLSDPEALQNVYFDLTGILTGNRNVIVPNASSANRKLYIVKNSTTGSFTLTVKTSAGTGITIAQGSLRILYCDGTNVVAASGEDTGGAPLWVTSGFFPGAPVSSQLLLLLPIPAGITVTFPANLTGSKGRNVTTATGTTTFSIRKNNSEFATMVFAGGAATSTFTGSLTSLSGDSGDYLSIIAPGSVDATLADIGYSLKGTR